MQAFEEAIAKMRAKIVDVLAENVPSAYLHGSCALGDFRPGWSDIDLLILTEKPISRTQAETLVGMRQRMCADQEDDIYRCFEGGILSRDAFLHSAPDRVVYWGTSGQRITDRYHFDACSMRGLLDHGVLLYGQEIRARFAAPSFADLVENIRFHCDTIRTCALHPAPSLYSYGWILDICRGIYTLRTGRIIAKTMAGRWALAQGIFPDPAPLEAALRIRENPLMYRENTAALRAAEALGPAIQAYADVLEREIANVRTGS